MITADILPGVSALSHDPQSTKPLQPGARLDRGKLSIRYRKSPANVVTFYAIAPRPDSKKTEQSPAQGWEIDSNGVPRTAPPLSMGPNFTASLDEVSGGESETTQTAGKDGRSGWGGLPKQKDVSRKTLKQTKEIAAALELEYGRENLRFLTWTLPASTQAAYEVIARWSSWIIDVYSKRFTRLLGSDYARLQVYEYQKRGALHCHMVIGSQQGIEKLDDVSFQGMHCEILDYLSEKTGVDLYERKGGGSWKDKKEVVRADCQKIEKSVTAYLGKYLSKAETKIDDENNSFFAPASWAYWNRKARQCQQKHTHSEILGFATPDQWQEIKAELPDMLDTVKADNTEVIDTAKKGRLNDCIYAIVKKCCDCMDAMGEIVQLIKSCLSKTRWNHQFIPSESIDSYLEGEARKQLAWEKKLEYHDGEINYFGQYGRRRYNPAEDKPISNGESLEAIASAMADSFYQELGETRPVVNKKVWPTDSWNSCNENFLVIPKGESNVPSAVPSKAPINPETFP